jgi:hypothetical protein
MLVALHALERLAIVALAFGVARQGRSTILVITAALAALFVPRESTAAAKTSRSPSTKACTSAISSPRPQVAHAASPLIPSPSLRSSGPGCARGGAGSP